MSTASTPIRNVLFIMCDQLRADHLSCYGGIVPTPHIDRLAAMGARFDRAYVTSAVCGPSRASFYTGRYPVSHRVTWNRVPMPVDELSLGDYLAQSGRTCHLLGKTHFVPHRAGLEEHGFEVDEAARLRYLQGGFTPVERYDGHFEMDEHSPYRQYLLRQGYAGTQPWTDHVIGSLDAQGELASGWYLRNAPLPARVREADSETAYLTRRAMDYIDAQGETPWVLHLSYIKPHWPYKAPAPYHQMFGQADIRPPVRAAHERESGHPVHRAYQHHEESESFARDEVWQAIRPVYMGLVKQIDDHIGLLMAHLETAGRLDDTLIVFTADHGDFLGDHWLGEKEYFFEPVMRVPFIVRDPRARPGQVRQDFVENIDVVPTVLDALGLPVPDHRIEGRSLLDLLHGRTAHLGRDFVVGSLDYAYRKARTELGRGPQECTGWMLREDRYKLIVWEGYPPQLFDLLEDPDELHDRGSDPALAPVRQRLTEQLLGWMWQRRRRTTETSAEVTDRTDAHERMMNILIGRW